MNTFTNLIPQMQKGKRIQCFVGNKTMYFFPFEIRDGVVGYEYKININERRTNAPEYETDFVAGFPKAYINYPNWKVV